MNKLLINRIILIISIFIYIGLAITLYNKKPLLNEPSPHDPLGLPLKKRFELNNIKLNHGDVYNKPGVVDNVVNSICLQVPIPEVGELCSLIPNMAVEATCEYIFQEGLDVILTDYLPEDFSVETCPSLIETESKLFAGSVDMVLRPTILESIESKQSPIDLIVYGLIMGAMFNIVKVIDYKGFYTNQILQKNNWFKWIDFGTSNTFILLGCARFIGVKEKESIGLIGVIAFISSMQGLFVEDVLKNSLNGKKKALILLLLSWGMILYLVAYIQRIFKQLIDDLSIPPYVDFGGTSLIPDWVPTMMSVVIITFNSYFITLAYNIFKYDTIDYKNVELVYSIQTLLTRTIISTLLVNGLENMN
jgi:hypothetical protein